MRNLVSLGNPICPLNAFATLYFNSNWEERVVKRFGEEDDSSSDLAAGNAKAWSITLWEKHKVCLLSSVFSEK